MYKWFIYRYINGEYHLVGARWAQTESTALRRFAGKSADMYVYMVLSPHDYMNQDKPRTIRR